MSALDPGGLLLEHLGYSHTSWRGVSHGVPHGVPHCGLHLYLHMHICISS